MTSYHRDVRVSLALAAPVVGPRPPREYTPAVRAVWECWQNRPTLQFHKEHYSLSPLIENPDFPIYLAAIDDDRDLAALAEQAVPT